MKAKQFLKKEYKDSWETIKKSKTFILVAIGVFILISILGFIFPVFFVDEINLILQNMALEFAGLTLIQTIIKIFSNNFMASLYSMFLGLGFGIMPLFNTVLNGYILGFVGNLAVAEGGFGVLLRLLPHGIFEIPAIMVSVGSGLFLAESFIKNLFKVKKSSIRKLIIFGLAIILLPLLIYHSLNVLSIDATSITAETFSALSPSIILTALINLTIFVAFLLIAVYAFRNEEVKKDMKSVLKVLVFIVLPLLIIAGIIEGLFMFLA